MHPAAPVPFHLHLSRNQRSNLNELNLALTEVLLELRHERVPIDGSDMRGAVGWNRLNIRNAWVGTRFTEALSTLRPEVEHGLR
jgi:hypothetical protein